MHAHASQIGTDDTCVACAYPPQFIFSVATLVLSGKYLERVWGRDGFIQFTLFVVVVSNVIACAVNILEHFLLQDSGMLLCAWPPGVAKMQLELTPRALTQRSCPCNADSGSHTTA